jgi:phosphatidate cytidylyltransferase
MAIDKKTLQTRTLTAVIFAVVMLSGLFISGYSFIALFVVIMIGCAYEVLKITRLIKPGRWGRYVIPALIYAMIPMILMIDLGYRMSLLPFIFSGKELTDYSFLLPVAVILSIWINDTMAYIVGSMIGKTPFSKISPKKTWEGTIGGAVLCVIVMGLIGYFLPAAHGLALKHWLIIAAIAAIAGTAGDLFESKLKRLAGVKDSGSFMPGHGGFLDRFDSLLFATPIVWLYLIVVAV